MAIVTERTTADQSSDPTPSQTIQTAMAAFLDHISRELAREYVRLMEKARQGESVEHDSLE